MEQNGTPGIPPRDLIEALKSYPFLGRFQLAQYCHDERSGIDARTFCTSAGLSAVCSALCLPSFRDAVRDATRSGRYSIHRCAAGVFTFIIPLAASDTHSLCLLGSGVRDKMIDLWQLEGLVTPSSGSSPISFLTALESLPTVTHQEVEEAARKIMTLLPGLQEVNPYHALLQRIISRVASIKETAAAIDAARTADDAAAFLGETLGVLFDIPRIAIALPTEGSSRLRLRGAWNLEGDLGSLTCDSLLRKLESGETLVLPDEDAAAIFPHLDASRLLCVPLFLERRHLGFLALFNVDLTRADIILVELLAARFAARFVWLRAQDVAARARKASATLLSMITALASADTLDELYRRMTEMAIELVAASNGSVMLLDEGGETLRIAQAVGMNPGLARTLTVGLGEGIAGRVAATGHPLLVNDIEKDRRFNARNRPRFRTKSFISVPLVCNSRVLGVLNVADKSDSDIFSRSDLDLLVSFSRHAGVLVDRIETVERAKELERLSITDPLTGLYNRRFLEKRLAEELSRCTRQKQSLTVMLIDLDNFKVYNDHCGHPAGDRALAVTAEILAHSARQMDVVARYGGEEFCIILPGTSKKESLFVAERVRRGIEQATFPEEAVLPQGKLTTSIGIATFPEDGTTSSALVEAADIALYRTKACGKNNVLLFDPAMRSEEKVLPQASPLSVNP